MSWWLLAIPALGAIAVVGVVLKVVLRRRLRDIDGAVSVHEGEDVVVADLGDHRK